MHLNLRLQSLQFVFIMLQLFSFYHLLAKQTRCINSCSRQYCGNATETRGVKLNRKETGLMCCWSGRRSATIEFYFIFDGKLKIIDICLNVLTNDCFCWCFIELLARRLVLRGCAQFTIHLHISFINETNRDNVY